LEASSFKSWFTAATVVIVKFDQIRVSLDISVAILAEIVKITIWTDQFTRNSLALDY
jgi:hypothetical protein